MLEHLILGTAGHIDHGKSSLVKALTGTDPDRWKEEKQRGITIDLGFAHYLWQDRLHVSFVDVPGHEKFVHNMVAGINGLDGVLLVVAADEGVMPQTREHLAICGLLGVKRGLVVLTRLDLAEPETLELVEEEVTQLVEGSFLEGAPLLKTSATQGTGLEELRQAIARLAGQEREPGQIFRMPLDRVFSLSGFGTVVTGTVQSGQAEIKDELWVYPLCQSAKIRGFQSHGQKQEKISQGQRAAVNLSNFAVEDLRRGYQLAPPGRLVVSRVLEVALEPVPGQEEHLKKRFQASFHCQAQETQAKVQLYANQEGSLLAQLRLDQPIACLYGDRFLLRGGNPQVSLAGGMILAPLANRSRRNKDRLIQSLTRLHQGDQDQRLLECLYLAGPQGALAPDLSPLTGLSQAQLTKRLAALASQEKLLLLHPERKGYIHPIHLERILAFLVRALGQFHKSHPDLPGARPADLGGKLGKNLELVVVEHLLRLAHKRNLMQKREAFYHLPQFEGGLTPPEEDLKQRLLQRLFETGVNPPALGNLALELNRERKEIEALLKKGTRQGWAVRVKEDLYYHPQIIQAEEERLLATLRQTTKITVIQYKDLIGAGRKHAISLLEYFDGRRLTSRVDNDRYLHPSQNP